MLETLRVTGFGVDGARLLQWSFIQHVIDKSRDCTCLFPNAPAING